MKNVYTYDTAIGKITMLTETGALTNLYFGDVAVTEEYKREETQLHKKAIKELREYFAKERILFTLPLNPIGTDFQQRVWTELTKIPYGKVSAYKDIAQNINNPKGCRAVGNANGKNPLPIFIPCHRVIASNGTLGGFSCGLDMKIKLLDIEGVKL